MRYYKFFLIIIFLLFIPEAFSFAQDSYIPIPAQTTKETEQEMMLNGIKHKIQAYQSSLSPDEILDFYKGFFIPNGWEIKEIDPNEQAGYESESDYEVNEDFARIQATLFSKGKDIILLTFVKSEGGKTNYMLNYSYGRTEIFEDKDSPGKDLEFIPRYPGSIRYVSIETEGMTLLNYHSKDSKEQIEKFYQSKMPKFGWKGGGALSKEKISEITKKKMLTEIGTWGLLTFESDRGYCMISVALIEKSNLNNIGIIFIPKGKEESQEYE
ncbi:MAG: hypothetical protein NC826_05000 [Candidatus Omnitrophica bacterium]|nr:hypothetical protein [Candidatus Omnitrophota bacterium]